MNRLILGLLLTLTYSLNAQTVHVYVYGMQASGQKAALENASVVNKNTTLVYKTNKDGYVEVPNIIHGEKLTITAKEYEADTVIIDSAKSTYQIMLYPVNYLGQVDVLYRNYDVKIDLANPIKVEEIGEKELKKAACCNLAESFESNASVDVVYTDALTGARTVQMLGLSGLYAPIQIENIPYSRGLAANLGMSFIPGTWLNSIQITKGVGSVVNGYESMSGILNIELLKPENPKLENLFVNVYGNSMGRAEANIHLNKKLNDKWSTLLLLHGNGNFTENDMNNDGFRDNPLSSQINVMNRWKHQGKKTEQVIMAHSLYDEKRGGQTGALAGIDNTDKYGVGIRTQMHQVYFKNGFLFPKKTLANIGLIGSYKYHRNDSNFGQRIYNAEQHSGYFNGIYNNYIGNTAHTFKTGLSLIYDYTKQFNGVQNNQTEIVPGAFFEYSYNPSPSFNLLLGNRVDYHNTFKWQYTPRLHVKYQFSEKSSLRALIGTGFRTSKAIMENMSAMASSRIIIQQNNLLPEKSVNAGLSFAQEFKVKDNLWMFNIDYYYTAFMNQVVIDYDKNPRELNIYNLTGQSYAHSFQVELDMKITAQLQVKMAYKYYDVKQTVNNQLLPKALVAPNRIMFNTSYQTTNKKWKFEYISNWIDRSRIPNTSTNPQAYRFNEKGKQLYIAHIQVTKLFRHFETYIGCENIFNQTQRDAILAPNDPFGNYFDAGLIWGPLNGTTIYAGLRYSLRK